jgi:predicted protein tyrosine phosphatase
MVLFVYSRAGLEAGRPHEVPHAIISITSHAGDVAHLRPNATCRGILRLSFVDAEAPSDQHTEASLFSSEQADLIWSFVSRHLPDVERVIVHCDAGMSRSPAVAAAISKALTGDDAEFFAGRYRPNMRVYRFMLEAYARRQP